MASAGRFWLGLSGSESLFVSDGFTVAWESFEINREGRVANGALVIDNIATKLRFTIAYNTEAVGQTALDALVALYTAGVSTPLSLIIENEDASTTTYTVKFRPFSRVRMLTQNLWLWEPVTFVLEEV
jgi:hypothetical protein